MNKKSIVRLVLCVAIVGTVTAVKFSETVGAEKNTNVYTVQKGDCLDTIASHYIDRNCIDKNKEIYALRTKIKIANNINETIYPGERIVIPGGITDGE